MIGWIETFRELLSKIGFIDVPTLVDELAGDTITGTSCAVPLSSVSLVPAVLECTLFVIRS